jgi:hypothetical protein
MIKIRECNSTNVTLIASHSEALPAIFREAHSHLAYHAVNKPDCTKSHHQERTRI